MDKTLTEKERSRALIGTHKFVEIQTHMQMETEPLYQTCSNLRVEDNCK